MDRDDTGALFRAIGQSAVTIRVADQIARERWYRQKGGARTGVTVKDLIPLPVAGGESVALVLLRVEDEGGAETYALPLRAVSGGFVDAAGSAAFAQAMLAIARTGSVVPGKHGALVGVRFDDGARLLDAPSPEAELLSLDQTNTVLVYGSSVLGKLLRSVEDGASVELEIARFLAKSARKPAVPALLAAVSHRLDGTERTVMLFSTYVRHEKTALELFQGELAAAAGNPMSALARLQPLVELLARRTAELHRCLVSAPETPGFEPEAFDAEHTQALVERARMALRSLAPRVPGLAIHRSAIEARLERLLAAPVRSKRIRCHGDFHLGQVLFTGTDFVIIDFEGEPGRSLEERREKRSPLSDVSSMLRSFDYALELTRLEDAPRKLGGALSTRFLAAYLDGVGDEPLLFSSEPEASRLLEFFLLEKCLYEIAYELEHRPDFLDLPLRGLERLLSAPDPR